jgi:hypothetical protein
LRSFLLGLLDRLPERDPLLDDEDDDDDGPRRPLDYTDLTPRRSAVAPPAADAYTEPENDA